MDGRSRSSRWPVGQPGGRRRRLPGWRRAAAGIAAAAIAGALAPLAMAGVAGAAPGGAGTVYVSPTGHNTGTCSSTGSACASLGYALAQAAATDTVLIKHGTYKESATATHLNVVPATKKGLVLKRNPATTTATPVVITATGEPHGIVLQSSTDTITGLTVQNALMSGIRVSAMTTTSATKTAAPLTNVTISKVNVLNNDKCTASPTTASCKTVLAATPHADFGEGIHLETVATSKVVTSTVKGNSGGILLTDEHGPTHANTISGNTVVDNLLDCGITLASHNPNAVITSGATAGKTQPTKGGVYANVIKGNTSSTNGDSGVLLAAPMPGAATYTNTVTANTLDSNGHAGVTIHSHAPFQDVNNNKVLNNSLASDALSGDSTVSLTQTAAIVIYSAAGAITGTQIKGNTITHVFYGVWMSSPTLVTKGTTITGNTISVTAGGSPTYTQPAPNSGYFEAGSDGAVYAFGAAVARGSMAGTPLVAPVVGMATTPDEGGYWLAASDGGIFAFGDAGFYGSMGGKPLNEPMVGMTPTATSKGYWTVASDGGIFAFGTATFYGSMGGKPLNKPIVGMEAMTTGKGYWMVASDGGIFAFGTAGFFGSNGGKAISAPIVAMSQV